MRHHTLTITLGRPDGVTYPRRYLAVECPGVDDDCREWRECRRPGCDPDDDGFDHGVEHQHVAGGWSVPEPHCFLRCYGNGLEESAEELAPGRYEFTATFNDDGGVRELTVIETITT
jgi:hypothetical protein